MSMRTKFDEIYNSMVNGQRKQAIFQASDLDGYDTAELLDYIAKELNQPEVALDFAKSYFRITFR